MNDEICVDVRDLGQRFGTMPFLWRHVTFSVRRGQTIALCGRSGCGKSTLLSIVAGWFSPTEGEVRSPDKARVSWVFQNPYGAVYRTVLDIAAYPLITRGWRRAEADAEALRVLAEFGLDELRDRLFAELSGGEAQRLMLVRAINSKPDILLVDEPTAQLDSKTALVVDDKLVALAGRGAAVLIATHDRRTRESCDRVIDLDTYSVEEGSGDEAT
ncbi:ATP-binding cassette domain-containing protein [Bifidobacterium callitrichos]|uniref:ABC transporter n=1 Tax=Bifidobacterium callitrichos DSM 23973 TaxID=1437609 RepID=A0A086ZXS5_9BIFI|nr:ATP-binding cassette domain-containing protein [Bifidobacterium callitrichos]KFI51325.1 ABC transporter [Bifidobacterium callitrichos DSM 23973]